jgi:glycosyltransferase family protein
MKITTKLEQFYEKVLFKFFPPYRLLKSVDLKIQNLRYEWNSLDEIFIPHILTSAETIDRLLQKRSSICRYGDGEFRLMKQSGEAIGFQGHAPLLAQRLSEVLTAPENENILIGIPRIFGNLDYYTNVSGDYWRSVMVEDRQFIYQFLSALRIYGDSLFSRCYIDYKDKSGVGAYFEKMKELWNGRDVVLIEGEYTRFGVGNQLLDGARSVRRLLCPPQNAFAKYAQILSTACDQPKDSLFLLALGPTATVLAYDLAIKGFQAIDIGHLDIEYNWFLMGATVKTKVTNRAVNEAGANKAGVERDETYRRQIFASISLY